MTLHRPDTYRLRFDRYLRKGTPIDFPLEHKEDVATDRYVWRTRRDAKVRTSHRMNDGRIFSWSEPPTTGHPGEAENCRCEAIPYRPGETEFAFHTFSSSLDSPNPRWNDRDFVRHFYWGGGRAVTLWEIGHLRQIAELYAYDTGAEGAFRRLSDQIASAARKKGEGSLHYEFNGPYDFSRVAFSHGYAVVRGDFRGSVVKSGRMLQITGESNFKFSDDFTDPLDFREHYGDKRRRYLDMRNISSIDEQRMENFIYRNIRNEILENDIECREGIWESVTEVGGTAYHLSGDWAALFIANVDQDPSHSNYRVEP